MTMPNVVKQHHPGYSGGQASSSVRYDTREGDPEIVELMNRYTGPEAHSTTWEFRRQVIAAAVRLLKGNSNWFILQDTNPMVQEYNYLFLQDTLRYIATGHRQLSVYAWQDLLTHTPETALKDVKSRHEISDKFKELTLSTSLTALIQRWLSHPKGFDDFMFSLHLMFGRMDMRYEYND